MNDPLSDSAESAEPAPHRPVVEPKRASLPALGLAASVGLHAAALAMAAVGFGLIQPFETPGVASISVELIGEEEFTLLVPDEPEQPLDPPENPGDPEAADSATTLPLRPLETVPLVVRPVPAAPAEPQAENPALPEAGAPADPDGSPEAPPEAAEPALPAPVPAVRSAALEEKRKTFAEAQQARREQGREASSQAGKSLGIWQTTDRKMDYEVRLCGDGRQLCGELVGLRDTADTAQNRQYLNRPLVDRLRLVGPNTWEGTVTIQGYVAAGTVKINPGQSLVINACVYLVICQEATLIPAR